MKPIFKMNDTFGQIEYEGLTIKIINAPIILRSDVKYYYECDGVDIKGFKYKIIFDSENRDDEEFCNHRKILSIYAHKEIYRV